MKSNVPPGAAEDPTAPYNEKTKIIEVTVSQCLSTTVGIEVPEVQVIDNTIVKVSKPAYVKELLSVVIKNHNSNNKILSKQNEQLRPINN